ncbi:MAG: tryptophan synthase subunit alpha [Fusobacteriota bacterium]
MMTIEEKFKVLKEKDEKALITYVAGGDPDYKTSKEIIKTLIDAGADIVEIGIPFSDPMADGPTIQLAAERSLKNGFSLRDGFEMVSELREEGIDTPFIFMSYYNPIFVYGVEKFSKKAKEVGLNGTIIPDLPPEAAEEFLNYKGDLDNIFLISPTMNEKRLNIVSEKSSGFVYFVSVSGVTGARTTVNKKLSKMVKQVQEKSGLPVGVGFGVSSREQVEEISEYADAVIVGSAIVKNIEENIKDKELIKKKIYNFVKELKEGTKKK